MATRKVKITIELEKLKISVEGTQDAGQQVQQLTQAFGGLLNSPARLVSEQDEPTTINGEEAPDHGGQKGNGQSSPEATGEKSKQPRQRRARGGPSIANLLLT